MFKEEVTGRKCFPKDGNEIIKTLVTTLVDDRVSKETDALDDCIMDMFGEIEELQNTKLTIHDDYTVIPDIVTPLPDVAITIAQPDVTTEQIDKDNSEQDNSTKETVIKISLDNVFKQGRAKMIEMKIPEVRARKQNKILR